MFDRHFDGFYAAIDAKFVEDVRDMEFDRAKTHHQFFRDLVIVETSDHAFEHIAFALGQLFPGDLRLCDRIRQHLCGFR